MRSCGRFGPATLGDDVAEIEFEIGAVDRSVALRRDAEESLRLEIILEGLDTAPRCGRSRAR